MGGINLVPLLATALTFTAVVLLVIVAGRLVSGRQRLVRLGGVRGLTGNKEQRAIKTPEDNSSSFLKVLSRLSVPESGWQGSDLRLKFVRAGFRNSGAPSIYLAVKTLLFVALPLSIGLLLLLTSPQMSLQNLGFFALLAAVIGYYAPDIFLRFRVKKRGEEMQGTLPDLLDLLVICIESGLGLDAAMNRVSREIARTSPILSEEFYLAALEIRAGSGRLVALKNMALRIHLEDFYSLVSMLVQADKFGTSLGASLRIQSDLMRVKRLQRAEELAAKVPVKMLFPLVFFIFPSMMIVILGPAMMTLSAAFGK